MDRLLWVCLGSAIGGGARYLASQAALTLFGSAFPWGTLLVNVFGSYLIALVIHVALTTEWVSPTLRIFLTTGVLGGLTTYSTFNYETLSFVREGAWEVGIANMVATVVSCLIAGVLGFATGRLLTGG